MGHLGHLVPLAMMVQAEHTVQVTVEEGVVATKKAVTAGYRAVVEPVGVTTPGLVPGMAVLERRAR